MKTLVVYYSRTGNTRKVASAIADKLGADHEEIVDRKKRSGPMGWVKAGRDAGLKKLTKINEPEKDPTKYDLVVIGTPIWNGNISSPIRTYIDQNKLKFEHVAFFCTCAGRGEGKVFSDMAHLSEIKPMSLCHVLENEAKAGNFNTQVQEFVDGIHGHQHRHHDR